MTSFQNYLINIHKEWHCSVSNIVGKGNRPSKRYGHSSQGGCVVCHGISMGSETPTTPKQFNSTFPKINLVLKKSQLFSIDVKCSQCFTNKITRKTNQSNSDLFLVDPPASPAFTHEGQDIKKKILIEPCAKVCQPVCLSCLRSITKKLFVQNS